MTGSSDSPTGGSSDLRPGWEKESGTYPALSSVANGDSGATTIDNSDDESPDKDEREVKDRELKKYDTLMLDDGKKEKILELLIKNVRRRAGDVRASLKGIMNDLVDEVIREHHLLPDEFIELLERSENGDNASKLVKNLLESFFQGLQERRGHQRDGISSRELPFSTPERGTEQRVGAMKNEFKKFILVYGTEREERKVFDVLEKLQEKYADLDVFGIIKADPDIVRDLMTKIMQETRDIAAFKFEEAFRKNATVRNFLFERVLGEEGDKILTLEGPRKQLIKYLESIGFRLENLDRILSSHPIFKAREERQRIKRQQKVKIEIAQHKPGFGVTNGNSYHSWFARHFIKDIRDQRVPPSKRMDLAGTTIVNLATMSRIIVPKAEMREPIHMLVKEASEIDGQKRLLARLDLEDEDLQEANAMIEREIESGKRTIDKITRETLHFVPDSVPEKKMAVLIPAMENERSLKNLLEWCDNPSSFVGDHSEEVEWIVSTYALREYVANEEELQQAIERIVGHQAALMLRYWYKSYDLLPTGDTEQYMEKTRLYEAQFRRKFGIIPEEIKGVKFRWRILQEVNEAGEPVLRDFMKARVPSYRYEQVGDEEDESAPSMKMIDGVHYRVNEIEEVTLYEVTMHHQGEPLTLYFYSPDFENTGLLWNCKSFESRMISQLRQGDREPTDGTRACMAVRGDDRKIMRRAKAFVLDDMGGTTVKVEDLKNGRSKKMVRTSVTSMLSAHHRAAQRGARHHMRTKDGRVITETVETQLYTVEDLCIGWLSEKTVMSHDIYNADRSLELFRDVNFPGLIYPAMRDFNNEIQKYTHHDTGMK